MSEKLKQTPEYSHYFQAKTMTNLQNSTDRATQFYDWQGYRCSYDQWGTAQPNQPVLLLIHPIGVGLSRHFWKRFINAWGRSGSALAIFNPDLLGCGDAAKPRYALYPEDWADQLLYFVKTVVQRPVILVVQGALFPVAIEMVERSTNANNANGAIDIRGLILSGPPAWQVMAEVAPKWQQKLLWNGLFDSWIGAAFFQYAKRRQFLSSFSAKQLFASLPDIDEEWLSMLDQGAADPASRHAVFAFLARFWQKGYAEKIRKIPYPTLALFGETASSISKSGKQESPDQRLNLYLENLPQGEGYKLPGRNVLPYESTAAFTHAVSEFTLKLLVKID